MRIRIVHCAFGIIALSLAGCAGQPASNPGARDYALGNSHRAYEQIYYRYGMHPPGKGVVSGTGLTIQSSPTTNVSGVRDFPNDSMNTGLPAHLR